MKTITNIKFSSFEFDFGNEGNIDAEVFVEIDSGGQRSQVQHRLQLQNISFAEFMGRDDINALSVGEGFSSLIQSLRLALAHKAAKDLNMELMDDDFVPIEPVPSEVEVYKNKTEELEEVIDTMLGDDVIEWARKG